MRGLKKLYCSDERGCRTGIYSFKSEESEIVEQLSRDYDVQKLCAEKDKYPNLIFTTWETKDRPRQVIVSDMTAFKFWILYFEVTFYFDVFTKEILTYRIAARKGDRQQYIDGLEDVRELLKGHTEPVVLHTDQGSVYASVAYNELIKDTVIVRSMSRAGKPTDNPVNESINGWMKEELYIDFKISECSRKDEFAEAP